MLLLSKIDNHQFKGETEIRINQIVNQALENLKEIYESLNIKVDIVEKQHIRTHMDPTLASSLVNNLLKNAFVHNKKDGYISITLNDNTLSIANSGIEEALDADIVFQTFYKKGDNSSSTGLGLAITKAICNEYGFEISYKFVQNQHVFSVRFK